MTNLFSKVLLFLSVLSFLCLQAKADKSDPYKDYDESVFMDMTLEENINTPEIDPEISSSVKKYMNKLAQNLVKKGYIIDMTRNDEVMIVTVQTDELFFPNDTLLTPKAPAKLRPIIELLKDPMMMKLVYAVHTDNTGSEIYNMKLSHARNSSVYDWLLDNINDELIVIPYEMGDTDPIASNDSRIGRQENRRIEFFLVPGPKMITQARKGQLK